MVDKVMLFLYYQIFRRRATHTYWWWLFIKITLLSPAQTKSKHKEKLKTFCHLNHICIHYCFIMFSLLNIVLKYSKFSRELLENSKNDISIIIILFRIIYFSFPPKKNTHTVKPIYDISILYSESKTRLFKSILWFSGRSKYIFRWTTFLYTYILHFADTKILSNSV